MTNPDHSRERLPNDLVGLIESAVEFPSIYAGGAKIHHTGV